MTQTFDASPSSFVVSIPRSTGKTASGNDISPSSTLDLLPCPAPIPSPRRTSAQGNCHALCIRGQAVFSAGASQLEEEGEVFVGHLGLGAEWGAAIVSPTPITFPEGLSAVVEVAAGSLHSLLLSDSGGVWSMGAGWEGPLGHGDEASLGVPRLIASLEIGRAHV